MHLATSVREGLGQPVNLRKKKLSYYLRLLPHKSKHSLINLCTSPLSFSIPCVTFFFFLLLVENSPTGKESACDAGDLGSIPGLGRSPGGGHGNQLQYSCLENPHGQRSQAGCSPWGCKMLDMTE